MPLGADGDVDPSFTASRVWPAAFELATAVAEADVAGKRAIELGAGAGLAGLAAAAAGADVTLTDLPENLDLLRRNAAANGLDAGVAALDWRDAAAAGLGRFDVVLAADAVFWPVLFDPLLDAMAACAAENATILLAVAHRLDRTELFFERLLDRGWTAARCARRDGACLNTDVYDLTPPPPSCDL